MDSLRVQVRNLTRTVMGPSGPIKLLDSISVDFKPGEVTALIGPSGCGKSTLLKAICGIERADDPAAKSEGVFYNGYSYYENIEALSRWVAYLPQFDNEWLHDDLRVQSELDYTWCLRDAGSEKVRSAKIRRGAIQMGLRNRGISNKRTAKVSELSGGQKKKAAILGAMLANPRLLLLDEPTAPLDPGSSAKFVSDLVAEVKQKKLTTIMVTHDAGALQGLGSECHVVLMKASGGKIAFDGTYGQLINLLGKHYADSKTGAKPSTEICLQRLFKDFSDKVPLDFLDSSEKYPRQALTESEVVIPPRPSALKSFWLLLKREVSLLVGNGRAIGSYIAIPLVLALILGVVANKDELYISHNTTKAMMFSLSACAFFAGVFDSIGVFANKKRIEIEVFHGLKTGPYVMAVSVVMTVLCLVQSLVLYCVFTHLAGLPSDFIYKAGFDMFVTAFLCTYSAAMLGMMCSSLLANTTYLAPVLVVIQIVFSGMIFTLEGVTKSVSRFVSCHWAMNALSAICDLNSLPVEVDVPNIGTTSIYYSNSDFDPESFTLFSSWLMLLVLGIGALLICLLVMRLKRRQLFHPMFVGVGSMLSSLHSLILRYAMVPCLVLALVCVFALSRSSAVDVPKLLGNLVDYARTIGSDIPSFVSDLLKP